MKRKQYKVSEAQIPMFDFDHPHMPVLDVSRCEARLINYETAARMVETYHYAHRVPSIVVAVGMFVDGTLAGCICYGTPATANQRRLCGEEYTERMLELNRLFIFDWAGRNSESWLIGQSFKYLERHHSQYTVLLSYADEGQNHKGLIYRATNWLYTGIVKESNVGAIINGTEYHNQTIVDMLGTRSVSAIKDFDTQAIIIDGTPKHRYVYFLGNKRQRRALRQALKWPILPYPKGKQNEIGL